MLINIFKETKMYENINDDGKIVKLRKSKRCEWCGEVIEVGEEAIRRVYKWWDEFRDTRMHLECYEGMEDKIIKGDIEFADGFIPYSMERPLHSEAEKLNEETIEAIDELESGENIFAGAGDLFNKENFFKENKSPEVKVTIIIGAILLGIEFIIAIVLLYVILKSKHVL